MALTPDKTHPQLGPFSGAALIFNSVLGAGILVLPGLAAAKIGAQSFWSWLIAAFTVIPFLIVFSILAIRYSSAGGIIYFAQRAFGPIGKNLTLALMLGATILGLPSIALTGGYYLQGAFFLPAWIGACLILITTTIANLFSVKGAARIGTYSSISVMTFLLLLVLSGGWTLYHMSSVTALPPPTFSALSPFSLIFFAFTGWEFAPGMADNFKNPAQNFPLAMALSWLLAFFFYGLCAFIIMKGGPSYWNEHPFLEVMNHILGDRALAQKVVALGACLLIWANLFTLIWSLSRIVSQMIPFRPLVIERNGIPFIAVTITGGTMTTIVLLTTLFAIPLSTLLSSAGMNVLLIYGITALILERTSENMVQRLTASFAILLAVILALQEPSHLVYPVIITAATIIVSFLNQKRTQDKQ
ncbi:amino acid permease [Acetobacteraceae bacterium ESL0709]|nr:amino acid permease [Acetobacteraceae bacterium ESL0697]MDF7677311.1 amino acid permease [Acetobacteraceae bacterium ESL0709]